METSLDLYRKIRRIYRLSQKYDLSHMESPDLTPSEVQLLRHIGFHGEVSQRHLAEDLNVDKAMITRTLQKLEAKGYLSRRESETDARKKTVIALEPAKNVYSRGRGLSEEFFDRLTEGFSADEIRLLQSMLTRMVEKGREVNGLPPSPPRAEHTAPSSPTSRKEPCP